MLEHDEITGVRPVVCVMRFLRKCRIDFGAGRGIVGLLMVGLLGLPLKQYERD